jgi:hypothetical protein
MNLHERYKNFPIKFYKNLNSNKIEYESAFTVGQAKNINDAFKEFSREDFIRDLWYYYDDIVDVEFGSYEPALTDKKRNGRQYLGKLNLKLDLSDQWKDSEQSVAYLSKHKEKIPAHLNYIKKLKRSEKIDKIKEKVKNLVNKIYNFLTRKTVNEFFDPIKSTTELVCKHCGKSIPVSSYYDTYRKENYHLECIWDKLVNQMPENSYEEARKFFFGLEKFIGDWPIFGCDNEEDYVHDLELVKHNDRTNHSTIG